MSTLASPMAPGEHIGRVREEGGEDWDPTCFGKGLLCAGSHPGPWAAGAHWEHAGMHWYALGACWDALETWWRTASPAWGWEPKLLGVLQGLCRQALWLQKIQGLLSTLRMHFDVMIHTSVVFGTALCGLDSVPSNKVLKIIHLWSIIWQRPWHRGERGLWVGVIYPGYPKCTQGMVGFPSKAERLLFNCN